jgi:hypothetical protein
VGRTPRSLSSTVAEAVAVAGIIAAVRAALIRANLAVRTADGSK